MGNSGSTHNLNIERSTSELNSYLQTQQLRRTSHRGEYQLNRAIRRSSPNGQPRSYTAEWRKSFPTSSGGHKGSKSEIDVNPQFKVLPKLDERLHLRSTANGAILNSGGTISGRKNELPSPAAMHRSRNFMFDSMKNVAAGKKNYASQAEFTRSQTLLHVKVKVDKAESPRLAGNNNNNNSNLQQMQRHTSSEPDFIKKLHNESKTDKHNMAEGFARPLGRQNKYNKKRRAPEAPPVATPTPPPPASPFKRDMGSQLLSTGAGQNRQQLFTKNSERDRASKMHVQRSSERRTVQSPNTASFERGQAERKSVQGQASEQPKFVYRREKSSDAILLKSRKPKELEVEAKVSEDRRINQSNRPQSTDNLIKRVEKVDDVDRRNNQANRPQSTDNLIKRVEKADDAVPATKIPQLKRTFYFGMDLDTPATTESKPQLEEKPKESSREKRTTNQAVAEKELKDEGASLSFIASYDIDYDKTNSREENIDDNGLRVRIRPTLPRRQIDTPSFSPALAWRALIDEQDRLERAPINNYRHSQPELLANKRESAKGESPIQPRRTPRIRQVPRSTNLTKAWTPEQDLGDDHDDRDERLVAEDDSSSDEYRSKCEGDGLLFYGSKSKKSGPVANNATSPIHLFSLSLPRDAHIQHHMDSLKADNICIYKSLQKPKPGYQFGKLATQQPTAQRKTDSYLLPGNNISITQFDGSNNWMLHKNVSSVELRSKLPEDGSERQGMPSIEPQSLKFVTGGKHVMYLPGNYDKPAASPLKSIQPELPAESPGKVGQSRHFKNRQRHVPESLQDKTPIFPVTSYKEKSTKPEDEKPLYQRFSFHNPVRMLEKRLMPEKTVKVAEMEEARRKSELEALKRVEEDFQRKRANEKENIRHQLRLHFGYDDERHERYQSLPIAPVLDSYPAIDLNDTNNNLFCRDDPEGCVSSAPFAGTEAETCRTKYGAKDILD